VRADRQVRAGRCGPAGAGRQVRTGLLPRLR
jgi:hypothetical protein